LADFFSIFIGPKVAFPDGIINDNFSYDIYDNLRTSSSRITGVRETYPRSIVVITSDAKVDGRPIPDFSNYAIKLASV
jgi:hypothetical protein